MTETNVKINIKDVSMGEYMKIVDSIKDPGKTNAVYNCDEKEVDMQTLVYSFRPINLKAFTHGFSKKLHKVLGMYKDIVTEV